MAKNDGHSLNLEQFPFIQQIPKLFIIQGLKFLMSKGGTFDYKNNWFLSLTAPFKEPYCSLKVKLVHLKTHKH